jgi:hypothetical protein
MVEILSLFSKTLLGQYILSQRSFIKEKRKKTSEKPFLIGCDVLIIHVPFHSNVIQKRKQTIHTKNAQQNF